MNRYGLTVELCNVKPLLTLPDAKLNLYTALDHFKLKNFNMNYYRLNNKNMYFYTI